MNWLNMKSYGERGVTVVVVTGRLAKQLKALGDEKRLQIIRLLGKRSICVCELEPLVELTQPAVSHHLKILRDAELVTDTRHGKWIFYSLNDNIYTEIINTLTALPLSVAAEEGTDSEIDFCLACEQKKQN